MATDEPLYDVPELDHIIHLVSPGKLTEAIDQFQQLGFSVERGGVHADGLTQNALIVLMDGIYIELIEFLEKPVHQRGKNATETLQEWKQRRSEHWWWGRKVGWIDWCLRGGVADGRVHAIRTECQRMETQAAAERESDPDTEKPHGLGMVRYMEPQQGGRRALSGKEIRWNVTFPATDQRATYPFWCQDETPRWWRVPTPSPPHNNLSQGLSSLTLLYYPQTFSVRLASLQAILSKKPQQDTILPPQSDGRPTLPETYIEMYLATPEGPLLPLRIKAADDPAELQWLDTYGEGLFEVEISVAPEKLPISAPPDGIERETSKRGYGRLRLHPMRVQAVNV